MKHTLLLISLVYWSINSSCGNPVSQAKLKNLFYDRDNGWEWEISDPAITFQYPPKRDNTYAPIMIEDDTFVSFDNNINNNYLKDDMAIDLTNLEYLPEYSDKQSDDTFICIGSPKCPKAKNNYNEDHVEQKLDLIGDKDIKIYPNNDDDIIDITEDNPCKDETSNSAAESHSNNNEKVHESHNNSNTKQNSTIDLELLHLLYNIIQDINLNDKLITPVISTETDTNKEKPNFNNLASVLTNIIKDNVFINQYRPLDSNFVDTKEKIETEKSDAVENTDMYKKDKHKNENDTGIAQENMTPKDEIKIDKVSMINIINNTISVGSDNSITLPNLNKPNEVIVHIIKDKANDFTSSESNNKGNEHINEVDVIDQDLIDTENEKPIDNNESVTESIALY